MATLEVPGAQLYYETRGNGPLMLMVPGANGTAHVFNEVAGHLSANYTVVTYDRRGFSRSYLDGPQHYDRRLETDADDISRLIEHLSDEPATIFGSSSGGLIILAVLTSYPSVVRTLVPYESAAVKLLPDGQRWVDFLFGIYEMYRQAGMEPALKKFREQIFAASDREIMARAIDLRNAEIRANANYWFERELRQYPAIELDLNALLAHADCILPAAGRESQAYPTYQVSAELAKKLGWNLTELPGGHVGYLAHPADFARELMQALVRRDGVCRKSSFF
jgi:acetyltransferase/esterase